MGKTDYKTLVDDMENAMAMDQLFQLRDMLVTADEARERNSVLREYFAENDEKIKAKRAEIDKTQELLDTLNSTDNWTKCAEKKGAVVYFQRQEDNPCIFTKLETKFPSDPQGVVSLFTKLMSFFYETELMPHMYPRGMMRRCEETQQITKFSKTIVTQVGMPKPLNLLVGPREAHLMGKGYDMSERSQVVITVTTMETGERVKEFEVPPVTKGYSPFVLEGAYYFELTQSGIIFKMLQSLNLCSKVIPQPILNYFSKGMLPFETVANMKKLISNFEDSPWAERIKSRPEVYGDVEKRLAAFLLETYGIEHRPLSVAESRHFNDDVSTKMSVVSGSGRRRRKSIASRISRGFKRNKTRSRSGSGKKLSRNARRTYSTMNQVELYDFEMTNKAIKEVPADDDDDELENEQPAQPKGVLQLVVYFIVLVLVKLFTLAGRKQKLAKINPSFKKKYPALFK